jgi:hypothetical protein
MILDESIKILTFYSLMQLNAMVYFKIIFYHIAHTCKCKTLSSNSSYLPTTIQKNVLLKKSNIQIIEK